MPVEEWLLTLERLNQTLKEQQAVTAPALDKLAGYYDHLAELAKGYEKDRAKLQENLKHVYSWRDEVLNLAKILQSAN